MEKTARKKIRFTLSRRIALLFIVASILAGGLVLSLSHNYLFDEAVRESSNVAQAALIGAIDIIWTRDPDLSIFQNEAEAEGVHSSFRDICRRTGLKFLYLYTMEREGVFRYVVCAANKDEDDKWVNDTYGFGGIRQRAMYDAEQDALKGNPEGAREFINNEFGRICMWVTPLLNREGDVMGFIAAGYDMSMIVEHTYYNMAVLGIAGFFAFFLTFITSIFLIRHVVLTPVSELSNRMSMFTRTKKAGTASRSTIFSDEITDIEDSFNSMATEIEHYINDIEELTREKVLNQTQLDVARKIQCGIVPVSTSLKKDCFDISGFSRAAKEVGGDFYDAFELDGNRVCVLIGDVSGKGISAALFMMMVMSAVREKIKAGNEPDRALCQVNEDLVKSNPQNMFATVFAAVLDYENGMLFYANAGHNAPVKFGKEVTELPVESGIAVGLFEDADIVLQHAGLKDGEGIFIYTDGFTEAINGRKEQYGTNRLKNMISEVAGMGDGVSSEDFTGRLKEDVDDFSEGLEQFDDMTCVSLIYHRSVRERTDLLPDIKEVDKIRDMLLSSIKDVEIAKEIILCCEEVFVNIVNYSGADKISFEIEKTKGGIKVLFIDNGKEFDPVGYDRPVGEFDELDMGGMGIAFVKQRAEEMVYNRDKDRNCLSLVFDSTMIGG